LSFSDRALRRSEKDDVAVGKQPVEPFVVTADRHRADIQVAQLACSIRERLVLADADSVGGQISRAVVIAISFNSLFGLTGSAGFETAPGTSPEAHQTTRLHATQIHEDCDPLAK